MSHPASGWLILDKPRGLGSTQAVGMVNDHLVSCDCYQKVREKSV